MERSKRQRSNVTYTEPDEREFEVDSSSRRLPRKAAKGGKPSALDQLACIDRPVPGSPHLTYTVGYSEAGGTDADRVLREVEIDESAIMMTGQFAEGRRVVLSCRGAVVAAAIAESHQATHVLEIPILATSRAHRQEGHGSALFALVMELGAQLGLRIVVVSATSVSRRFWLAQGLHSMGHLDPVVSQALRALAQSGVRYGRFSDTTQMARSIPSVDAPGSLVAAALHKGNEKTPISRGVAPAKAAEMLGYEDMPPGSVSFTVDSANGTRTPICTDGIASKAVQVGYHKLQAFPVENSASAIGATGGGHTAQFLDLGEPGWAVRSLVPIGPGQVVMEITGELISESSYEARLDKRFSICLDSSSRLRGLPGSPTPAFLDLKKAGSLARLVRACTEAPNLEIVVLPVNAPPPGSAPQRSAPPTAPSATAIQALAHSVPPEPPVLAASAAPSAAAAPPAPPLPALTTVPAPPPPPLPPPAAPSAPFPVPSSVAQVANAAQMAPMMQMQMGQMMMGPTPQMGQIGPCMQVGQMGLSMQMGSTAQLGPLMRMSPCGPIGPSAHMAPASQITPAVTPAKGGTAAPFGSAMTSYPSNAFAHPAVAADGPSPVPSGPQAPSATQSMIGAYSATDASGDTSSAPAPSQPGDTGANASAPVASALDEPLASAHGLARATRSAASGASSAVTAAAPSVAAASQQTAPTSSDAPAPRRAYLVARHFIPANVELTWEPLNAPRRAGGRPSNAAAQAASAAVRSSNGTASGGGSSIASRGARCEVRQDDLGLRGAYFSATILSPLRHDGLVQVQYDSLYESVHKDILLTEWLKPEDWNAVRPFPPPPPDGFHKSLSPGDAVEVSHESGWWPATIKCARGSHHFEVSSNEYVALRRAYPSTQIRPRWRWAGVSVGGVGGGWHQLSGPP